MAREGRARINRSRKDKALLKRECDKAVDNARRKGIDLKPRYVNESQEEVAFLYVAQDLLVRRSHLPDLMAALDRLGIPGRERDCPVDELALVKVQVDPDDAVGRLIKENASWATRVSPHHALDTQAYPRLCPASEPELTTAGPTWVFPPPNGGAAPKVAVVDTGRVKSTVQSTAWLNGVTGESDDQHDDGPYGSHGTFVAGVLRGVCSTADVWLSNIVVGGTVTEVEIVADLRRAVERKDALVISMSAGMYTLDERPSIAFDWFKEAVLDNHPEVLFLSAAGNDYTDDPFYPAWYDWATGVGALTTDGGQRATYSNYGQNVNVWAPGDDHVNAFVDGDYKQLDGSKVRFNGLAEWSGTSFATPLVAGMVCRYVATNGGRPRQALDALMALDPNGGPNNKPRIMPSA